MGNLRYYEPDLVAVTKDGTHYIAELRRVGPAVGPTVDKDRNSGKLNTLEDRLAELRGFEPPTSAVQVPARFTAPSLPVLQGLLSKARRWIPP